MAIPSSDLSFLLANLFVGLCKGNRLLRPYSLRWQQELGYSVFRIEQDFVIAFGARIKPEIMMTSLVLGHTLLFEWTEVSEVIERKKVQLLRYDRTTVADLIQSAGIPGNEAQGFDFPVLVLPHAHTAFADYLQTQGYTFPLLTVLYDPSACMITIAANEFGNYPTQRFFGDGVVITELPTKYVPFSLDRVTESVLAPLVVRRLMSLLVKDINEISLIKFSDGLTPIWTQIGEEKRAEISNKVRVILSQIHQRRTVGELFERLPGGPIHYRLSPDVFAGKPKYYRRMLEDAVASLRGESYQTNIFDDLA